MKANFGVSFSEKKPPPFVAKSFSHFFSGSKKAVTGQQPGPNFSSHKENLLTFTPSTESLLNKSFDHLIENSRSTRSPLLPNLTVDEYVIEDETLKQEVGPIPELLDEYVNLEQDNETAHFQGEESQLDHPNDTWGTSLLTPGMMRSTMRSNEYPLDFSMNVLKTPFQTGIKGKNILGELGGFSSKSNSILHQLPPSFQASGDHPPSSIHLSFNNIASASKTLQINSTFQGTISTPKVYGSNTSLPSFQDFLKLCKSAPQTMSSEHSELTFGKNFETEVKENKSSSFSSFSNPEPQFPLSVPRANNQLQTNLFKTQSEDIVSGSYYQTADQEIYPEDDYIETNQFESGYQGDTNYSDDPYYDPNYPPPDGQYRRKLNFEGVLYTIDEESESGKNNADEELLEETQKTNSKDHAKLFGEAPMYEENYIQTQKSGTN